MPSVKLQAVRVQPNDNALTTFRAQPGAGAVVRCNRSRTPPFEGHEYPSSVTADAQGHFAMPGTPSRACILIAISADDTEAAALRCLPMEQPEVEFRLAPPGSVVGVAYDADGKPVAGMKLGCHPVGFNLPPGGRFRTDFSTRTDERGRYRIEGLIAGFRYSLQYLPPGTSSFKHTKYFTPEGGEMPHVMDIYLEQ